MKNFPTKEDLNAIMAILQTLQDMVNANKTAPPKWLKVYEVCNMLGICKNTVYRLCEDGLLHPTKLRGQLYFSHEDVIKMMQPQPIPDKR